LFELLPDGHGASTADGGLLASAVRCLPRVRCATLRGTFASTRRSTMQKNPPYQQWKDKKEVKRRDIGRKALQTLSPALQDLLLQGLVAADKSRFDGALNSLAVDEPTRGVLLAEIKKEAPTLTAPQAETLVKRCFRRKVNTLRCLGQTVLLEVLDEVRPGASKAAGEALPLSARPSKEQTAADKVARRAARRAEKLAMEKAPSDLPMEQSAAQGAEIASNSVECPVEPTKREELAAPEGTSAKREGKDEVAPVSKRPRSSDSPA